jgi:hypothetical protein
VAGARRARLRVRRPSGRGGRGRAGKGAASALFPFFWRERAPRVSRDETQRPARLTAGRCAAARDRDARAVAGRVQHGALLTDSGRVGRGDSVCPWGDGVS